MTPQEIDSMLIQQEQAKWDAFAQGVWGANTDLYAEDFINIGWFPTGILRQTKAEAFAPVDPALLPPPMVGQISLSDFIVVHANDDSAIVTYKVTAPFATMYVSSAWAERDGEWQTVLYQASPLAPANDGVTAAALAGRYTTTGLDRGFTDAFFLNADGSYAVDSKATNEFGTTGQFEINDDLITFTDDAQAVYACAGSGTYQLVYDGSHLTFTPVADECEWRLGYLAKRVWTK